MSEVADGPETSTSGPALARSLEAARQLGHGLDDLVRATTQTWRSGDERQRAPPLARAAVEGDRAGVRAGRRAGRERAVQRVELARREALVLDELDAGGPQLARGRSAGSPTRRAPAAQRLRRRRPDASVACTTVAP